MTDDLFWSVVERGSSVRDSFRLNSVTGKTRSNLSTCGPGIIQKFPFKSENYSSVFRYPVDCQKERGLMVKIV